MLKRVIYVQNPYKLSTRLNQLIIEQKENQERKEVPIEDIACLMLDHPQISISIPVLQELSENNVSLIVCDKKHMPSAMFFNMNTHHVQCKRYRYQVAASEPMKKNLWRQTVKAKIFNQSSVLRSIGKNYEPLLYHYKKVRSDDQTNEEAKAAKKYWKVLFGQNFIRDRFGLPPNSNLNYGYAIIRAAIARSLAGSGLLPAFGINHHNKYNFFCLADDIMEPYRPFVDLLVYRTVLEDPAQFHDINTDRKAQFLSLLSADVKMGKNKSPMMIAMSQSTSSLAACFEGETKNIEYPLLIFDESE